MHKCIFAVITVGSTLLVAHLAQAVVPDSADIRQKVVNCFANGNKPGSRPLTIQLMHDCSGVWVTPRALLRCSLEMQCPVFSDALTDRGTFFQTLKNNNLDLNAVLVLPSLPDTLPPMPTANAIGTCKNAAETEKNPEKREKQFRDCVLTSMVPRKYTALLTCFQKKNDDEKASCFANQVNDRALTTVVQCLGKKITSEKFVECTAVQKFKDDIQDRRNCVAGAPTPEQALHCLTGAFNPEHSKMTDCLSKAGNGAEAVACLDQVSPAAKQARETVACINDPKRSLLSCAGQTLSGPTKDMATCLDRAKNYKSQLECASPLNPEFARAQSLSECVRTNPSGQPLLNCVAPYLGGDAQKFASCVSVPNPNLPNCLAALNPRLKSANDALTCLAGAKSNDALLGCVATQVGGTAPQVATCLTKADRTEIAPCLLGNKPEVRAAQSAYNCVAKSSDTVSVIGYCAQVLPIDDKTREALTCSARAGGDRNKLAQCVAGAVLPPEASRMVSCATSSEGATSFVLCAASPAINEEWRIASECAVQTGGVPVAFAGCTAGRLTVRELLKCLSGRIGQECFGENNTIVKTLTNAYNDITKGPGPNNEAVRAIRALTGGQNSVINNPAQLTGGPNSLINNPSQIWGGPNSVINTPSQIWGGPNSIVRNPAQLLGGPNSLVNNPGQILGGEHSVVREFIAKPLGGDCSFFHRPAGC
jgi:hypothetical protein